MHVAPTRDTANGSVDGLHLLLTVGLERIQCSVALSQ